MWGLSSRDFGLGHEILNSGPHRFGSGSLLCFAKVLNSGPTRPGPALIRRRGVSSEATTARAAGESTSACNSKVTVPRSSWRPSRRPEREQRGRGVEGRGRRRRDARARVSARRAARRARASLPAPGARGAARGGRPSFPRRLGARRPVSAASPPQRKPPPISKIVELALERRVLRVLVVLRQVALERRGVRDHDVAPAPADDLGPLLDHALELGHEGDRAPLLLVRRRHGRRHDGRGRRRPRRPHEARQRAARRPHEGPRAARGPRGAGRQRHPAGRRWRAPRRAAQGAAPSRPALAPRRRAAAAAAPTAPAPGRGRRPAPAPVPCRRRAAWAASPARAGARMAASSEGLHPVATRAAAAATGVPRRRAAAWEGPWRGLRLPGRSAALLSPGAGSPTFFDHEFGSPQVETNR